MLPIYTKIKLQTIAVAIDRADSSIILAITASKILRANFLGKKENIVKEFLKMIPDFGHKETGRYLDGTM